MAGGFDDIYAIPEKAKKQAKQNEDYSATNMTNSG